MNGNDENRRARLAAAALRCQPDARLVRLVREGHGSAFEEIVRRYRAPLVTYAGGIVPDHHAEDVVQEALTRAHAALSRSQGEMNLKPWLFTIVRNGALNAIRDEPVHVHLDESYDGVPQPPEVVTRGEELAALTASLKGLPDQQREALVKRELEGRSHREIAASLGLSAGAVRGLIYRARAALRNGAGLLIPFPVLRGLLNSTPATPDATGAAGAAAAGLAGGGGGLALKAGATLGVAVIAVGSGIAVQNRDSGSAGDAAATTGRPQAVRAHGEDGSGRVKLADAAVLPGGDRRSGREGEGSGGSSPSGGGGDGSPDSGGPGPGSGSGAERSSGPGSGSQGSGDAHSSSGSGGDDGGGGSGDDGVGNSGHGGGSSGSGSDEGGSGSSGDGGGEPSSSSDGGGDTTTTGDGTGDDGGGDTTTTTPKTTTTNGAADGSSGPIRVAP